MIWEDVELMFSIINVPCHSVQTHHRNIPSQHNFTYKNPRIASTQHTQTLWRFDCHTAIHIHSLTHSLIHDEMMEMATQPAPPSTAPTPAHQNPFEMIMLPN